MRTIERLKPRAVAKNLPAGYYADGAGLYLAVSATGAKSWVLCYMLNGRSREMGLGSAQIFTLAEARELALQARKLRAQGTDPIEHRRAARANVALEAAKNKTFAEVALQYIADHRKEWSNEKHVEQWETTLGETYCKPILALPVQGIDAGQVVAVLKPIWNEKRETAVRLRGRIEKVLDAATALGYRIGPNPARWRGNLDHLLAKDKRRERVQHHAALPFNEAGAFMVDLRAIEGTAARALELAILTATRTGEVIGATWAEIDLDGATWKIPAQRMKGGREHRVPLSPAAVALLRALPRRGDYVFSGRSEARGLSNMSMLALLRRMGRADLTTHGFRSTFRDWSAERTNFANHVVEMALAHAIGDGTEAAYRRGDLFEKRRRLMIAWANYLSVREAAKVTSINRRTTA